MNDMGIHRSSIGSRVTSDTIVVPPLRPVTASTPYRGADGRWYAAVEITEDDGRPGRRYLSARSRRAVELQLSRAERSGWLQPPDPPSLAKLRSSGRHRASPPARPGSVAASPGRPRHRFKIVAATVVAVGIAGGVYTLRPLPTASSRELPPAARPRLLPRRRQSASENPFDSPAIKSYLATRTGGITMALYNAQTGQTSLFRPGVVQTTASIIKVGILATMLHQAELTGRPISATNAVLATSMIENSDDDAAQTLWEGIGGARAVGAFDSLAGLRQTKLNTKGYWGLSTTTALDQVAMMKTVAYPNALLDPASRAYELGLMGQTEADQTWGVSAGVPAGVTVELKDGWDPLDDEGADDNTDGSDWQINSIGWVDGDGRNYVLAVLTLHNATEGYGIATIQGIAPLVWDELAPAA